MAKTYEDIMYLRDQLYGDPHWTLIDETAIYGGKSDQDIDVCEIYLRTDSSTALAVSFNPDSKMAKINAVTSSKLESILDGKSYVKRR